MRSKTGPLTHHCAATDTRRSFWPRKRAAKRRLLNLFAKGVCHSREKSRATSWETARAFHNRTDGLAVTGTHYLRQIRGNERSHGIGLVLQVWLKSFEAPPGKRLMLRRLRVGICQPKPLWGKR